jgi:outer membrane biogenesis lipoprotein LolB
MSLPRRLLALCAVMLLVAGCAAKTAAPPGDDQARVAWESFRNREKASRAAWRGFRMDASLSFASQRRSGRLNLAFYGNLDTPLRLDLTLPVGGPYAFWMEDGSGFVAYYPGNQTAYSHRSTREGLSKMGLPLPFDLRELAAVAIGRFDGFLPASYASVKKRPDGFEYAFASGSRLASLTLDFEGKPIHLTGRGIEPWKVAFEDYQADAAGTPPGEARRVVLTTPGGAEVKLRIKTLAGRETPWPDNDLALPIPPGTAVRSLDGQGEVRIPEL